MCCFGIQLNSIASIELFVHAMSNYQLSYFLEFSLSNVLYGGDRLLYSTVLSILSPLRRVHRGNLTRNGKHFFALQLKRQHHALTVILLCIVQCNIEFTHTHSQCAHGCDNSSVLFLHYFSIFCFWLWHLLSYLSSVYYDRCLRSGPLDYAQVLFYY